MNPHSACKETQMKKRFDVVGMGISALDYVGTMRRFPAEDTKNRLGQLIVQGGGNIGNALSRRAFRVKRVDTTGAGDAFAGGFIYGLLQGWPLERVLDFA